jgi:hypothetical protein
VPRRRRLGALAVTWWQRLLVDLRALELAAAIRHLTPERLRSLDQLCEMTGQTRGQALERRARYLRSLRRAGRLS